MTDFTSSETDADFHLVAVLQKFVCFFDFYLNIMCIDAGGQTQFLYINSFLLLSGFFFFLCLIEFVFTVVHNAAYGRFRLGRDVDQIEVCFIGQLLGFSGRNDTKLFAVFVNQSDFLVPNLFVNHQFSNCQAPPK